MTLPSSQKLKDYTCKASENEEKDIEIPYDITRDKLTYMVKKFNKRFYKNQKSRK